VPHRPGGSGVRQCGLLQPAGGQRGNLTGANPVDRGKAGSKLHVAGDARGLPISVLVSAANANDVTMFEAVVDDIPPIRTPSGRRRRRPGRSTRGSPGACSSLASALVLMSHRGSGGVIATVPGHGSRQPGVGLWRVWADVAMIGSRGGRWRGPRTSTASMGRPSPAWSASWPWSPATGTRPRTSCRRRWPGRRRGGPG
jgi:hypothetical protein